MLKVILISKYLMLSMSLLLHAIISTLPAAMNFGTIIPKIIYFYTCIYQVKDVTFLFVIT